jgi:hypothetical protein
MGKFRSNLLIIWLSFKWIFRVNLGDVVYYRKKKYIVCNGVRYNQWRLGKLDNGDEGWVDRNQCRKNLSIKNLLKSFLSGYCFYMSNWYEIWIREGIKDWMLGCKIW